MGTDVVLLLCGEAHEDAIDVTRKGGYFLPNEGWIDSSRDEAVASLLCLVPPGVAGMPRFAARVVKQKANVSRPGAKGWSRELIHNDDRYEDVINESSGRLFLVFLPAGKKGGHAFLLAFELADDDLSDDDAAADAAHDLDIVNEGVRQLAQALLASVELQLSRTSPHRAGAPPGLPDAQGPDETTLPRGAQLSEWVDLDGEARELNRRRLREAHTSGSSEWGHKISEAEHDALIAKRAADRRAENIVTWDCWFDAAREATQAAGVDVHLVLESTICPWELALHQEPHEQEVPAAPHCVRCASSDSEGSELDSADPASDGLGAYGDYVYRKMMRRQLSDLCQTGSSAPPSLEAAATASAKMWLHCVDNRDVGDRVLVPARTPSDAGGRSVGGGEEGEGGDISQVSTIIVKYKYNNI